MHILSPPAFSTGWPLMRSARPASGREECDRVFRQSSFAAAGWLCNYTGTPGTAMQLVVADCCLPWKWLYMLRIFGDADDAHNPSSRYAVSVSDPGWRQTQAPATPQ